ncbi:succinate dehydrogenase assembly factor 2 [Candidatus Pelagibacter sp.]|nr:succinate dehydrogenase assembly factor 2 [Candidatus Pelagibacter sp.]
MTLNKEDLKNKIIYRASYRGTKEMDILMTAFVKSLINDLDENFLKTLDSFVNMDDETLISIKKKESLIDYKDEKIIYIINKFQKFK